MRVVLGICSTPLPTTSAFSALCTTSELFLQLSHLLLPTTPLPPSTNLLLLPHLLLPTTALSYSTNLLLLSHLLLTYYSSPTFYYSTTALPKDWCLPNITVTVSIRSDQQCCESSPSIPRYLHYSVLPMYSPLPLLPSLLPSTHLCLVSASSSRHLDLNSLQSSLCTFQC
jgi:hypothetical protein